MDEERMNYITRSIYDMVEASNIIADELEEYVNKYKVAEIFYKAGLMKDDEYDSIVKYFEENDRVFQTIIDKTADFEKMHQDRLDDIEAFLFGGTCSEVIDGIIQWINSPDCDKNQLGRLLTVINKHTHPTIKYPKISRKWHL